MNLLVGTDAGEGALLEKTKQLDLDGNRQVAYFVKEEGAAISRLSTADAPLASVGEGALLMAEKLRLHKSLRQCGTVEDDKGLVLPQ